MTHTLKSLLRFPGMILLSTLLLIIAAGQGTHAGVPTGQWIHYPSFTTPAQKVIVAPGRVYYLSGGSLFAYNTDEDETEMWSSSGRLNGYEISSIYYNQRGHYLMVAYTTGNIDLIYDDGHMVNMSDIADSNIAGSKGVRSVAFSDGRAYILTDFGLVEYDDRRHQVVQSGYYDTDLRGIIALPEHIVVVTNSSFYAAPKGGAIRTLDDDFTRIAGWGGIKDVTQLNDTVAIVRRNEGDAPELHITAFQFRGSTGKYSRHYSVKDMPASNNPFGDTAGNIYFTDGSGRMIGFDGEGKAVEKGSLPEVLNENVLGAGKDLSDVWVLDNNGLGHYDLSAGKSLSERFRPSEVTIRNTAWIIPSADRRRAYFTNMGITNYRAYALNSGEGLTTPQQTTLMDLSPNGNGDIADVSLYGYEAEWDDALKNQKRINARQPVSPTRLAEDPDDPSVYYLATASEGVFKIKDGKLMGRYDETNAPVGYTYGWRVFDVAFDRKGNLWMVTAIPSSAGGDGAIVMLPAEKRRLSPDKVRPSDWKRVKAPGFAGSKDARVLPCEKSDMVFAFDTRMSNGLVAIDTRGTYDDFSDDHVRIWTSFTDQDGKNYTPQRISAIAEDRNGRVWLGSSMGVVEITNPAKAVESSMTINRIKVPRNDGTNSADYLVGSDYVYDIAVDNANRKWIATAASGLYLVNPSGSEIIDHYTADNSPLPSNSVNCVYADAFGNSVFVGTTEGIYEYGGNSSPAGENYDDIYAYPNPVRPEYTGPVTICGLMDGSLVKIADSAGNVLAQMRSEGGMAVWDACNASGRRVPSGVYYVMASTGGSDGSSATGAVAKILVID